MDLTKSQPFLNWLAGWESGLPSMPFSQAAPNPKRVAVLSVDLLVGFAYEGTLSSPRVAGIVSPIARLFETARQAGVTHFVLSQDCHPPDTPEFDSFGAHCVCGTPEAQTVPELLALPFSGGFEVIHKNSLSSAINTRLESWLNTHHQDIDTFIVVGDCTDLCTYQLAMYLRMRANAHGFQHQVIVPADCVQTYDMPVDVAQNLGIMPHDGDVLHTIFLYQMALNGIQVVAHLD